MENNQLPADVQSRIEADADKPGLTDRIIGEAKQFAFYNYCSAAHNADFDNLETWPYAAQVAYYAISNYMSGNPISWPYSTKTIPMDLKDAAFETALQQWKGEGKEDQKRAKDGLMRLMLSGIEEVSKDYESAKAYLEEEGVEMGELEENAKFVAWLSELSKLLHEAAAGQPVKINSTEARKWYDDGATPYQTFRETWNME